MITTGPRLRKNTAIKNTFNPTEITDTGHGDLIGYAIGGVIMLIAMVVTRFSIGAVLLFVLFITHALVGAVELGTDGWIQNITGNLFKDIVHCDQTLNHPILIDYHCDVGAKVLELF